MFSLGLKILISGCVLLLAHTVSADIVVQLNINRPINDVSDKFISFTLKPEDLYKALDGRHRKTITRMASMLSNAHVKFVGDFYFATKTDTIRLRNPTKIVWKGFNKWTKAVNWSMVIPVPYKPNDWDPMQALKILNTSQMVGIDEAIWQLGTDFGSSYASDYVSELKTLNIMVESFKPSVLNWQTMGADISAGSSPDETRRYVEMSRNLNVAFGWIQSDDSFASNSLSPSVGEHDPALKVLLKENVPVWLSLPRSKTLSTFLNDELMEGMEWAQTMGDAANVGFETIFKPLTLDDLETPKYGFYITALFKKIMGSRVYPARPLNVFRRPNKLYTHCANMVSGGLAFMVVNKNEQSLQIAVRSMNGVQDTEVWQYTLTMADGHVMLNNKKISVNSTLVPEIRRKPSKSMLQLQTPGMSVSFWVLPDADLEHCHFTEVETVGMPNEENEQKFKTYSSSDRLLKQLIKESTKPSFTPLMNLLSRHRRSLDNEDRLKRFVLESSIAEENPLVGDARSPLQRHIFSPERRNAALQWLSNILKVPQLKRNARESDSYWGPYFMTRDGKKTSLTKKITEIKKPEKNTPKYDVEEQEFDEEKFFKNVGTQLEPDYVRVPQGDVYLSNIASVYGDDAEEGDLKIETKKPLKAKATQQLEPVNEMKPLRLLHTEFFDGYSTNPVKPMVGPKLDLGSALNTLLFADPFSKSYGQLNKDMFARNFHLNGRTVSAVEKGKELDADSDAIVNDNDDDLLQAQIDISQADPENSNEMEDNQKEMPEKHVKALLDANDAKMPEKSESFYMNTLNANNYNVFGDSSKAEISDEVNEENDANQTKLDEIPWWDLSEQRSKRSLDNHYSAEPWLNNMISKDEDPLLAAAEISPLRLHQFEHKINEVVHHNTDMKPSDGNNTEANFVKRVVANFKDRVIKLVDIVSVHVHDWYNTLTKHMDSQKDNEKSTTENNRID